MNIVVLGGESEGRDFNHALSPPEADEGSPCLLNTRNSKFQTMKKKSEYSIVKVSLLAP
jgi:hypothetical protein